MATLTKPTLVHVRQLESAFGLAGHWALEPIEAGSVNSNFLMRQDGQRYFLRIYEQQDLAGAMREWALVDWLQRFGHPVPRRIAAVSGEAPTIEGKAVGLFECIDGVELCLARVAKAHMRCIGELLARQHSWEPQAGLGVGRFAPQGLVRLAERLGQDPRVTNDMSEDIRRAREIVLQNADLYSAALPQAVIHGDLFRDNVRWRTAAASVATGRHEHGSDQAESARPDIFTEFPEAVVLDWESAHTGPRLLDVAIVILSWTFRESFNWNLAAACGAAYRSRVTLSDAELARLPDLFAYACARFALTRIADFHLTLANGSHPRRHYARFFDRLRVLETLSASELARNCGLE